ncbi:MAG: SGNH/GDSL hydrolase family protein [Planctomycetes bacterium]|nr:SGNH/GDSL hydrolase family protein [Planctomycetota bacterium]
MAPAATKEEPPAKVNAAAKAETPSKAGDAAKAKRPNPAMAPVEDAANLPRVLLIGDSISIGYTVAVRELLKGKANVHRPPTNCASTVVGLKSLEAWLGDKKWDAIHFNWGLHDLKYIDEKGALVAVDKGKQQVPLDEYEKNLRQLVQQLKKTGAKLIWCATTPVPEGAAGRVPGDEVRYNEAAARVMKESGVETDDLYAVAKPKLKDIQQPRNVHFTAEGSRQLAQVVADTIQKALSR